MNLLARILTTILSSFLVFGTPTFCQSILLTDDFSDGDSSDWTTFQPGWSESGGVFHSTNLGANIPVEAVYSLGSLWTDYSVEVDMRTSSSRLTSDLRLHVRSNGVPTTQAGSSFARCSLFRDNLNQTFLVIGIQAATLKQQLVPFAWQANTDYRLKAIVSGDTLTCQVGGTSVSLSDSAMPPNGTIALRATHIPGDFDNLVVLATTTTNNPPIAEAGPDQNLFADGACQAEVLLDGRSSSDLDGDPLTFVWESPAAGILTGETALVSLPPGVHEFLLTVEDPAGATDTDLVVVTISDSTPPLVSAATAEPETLWPPDHKMRIVSIKVDATDNCTQPPSCQIADVTSNQPADGDGDGGTSPDWLVTGPLTAELRAERSGGRERIYRIGLLCRDEAGNSATAQALVSVPASRGKHPD